METIQILAGQGLTSQWVGRLPPNVVCTVLGTAKKQDWKVHFIPSPRKCPDGDDTSEGSNGHHLDEQAGREKKYVLHYLSKEWLNWGMKLMKPMKLCQASNRSQTLHDSLVMGTKKFSRKSTISMGKDLSYTITRNHPYSIILVNDSTDICDICIQFSGQFNWNVNLMKEN